LFRPPVTFAEIAQRSMNILDQGWQIGHRHAVVRHMCRDDIGGQGNQRAIVFRYFAHDDLAFFG
tara:strand:+ start:235 stop:426 length:192 start_codon:yes stop_codon:yes gene_type:complete